MTTKKLCTTVEISKSTETNMYCRNHSLLANRITLSFFAVKMDKMKNIQNFMLNNILYYYFSKKLAEKTYSTFNLRLSLVRAAASPIKQNCSRVCVITSCMVPIHQQEAEPAKCLKSKVLITFFSKFFWKNGSIKWNSA